jgi:YHS domain-containing protein
MNKERIVVSGTFMIDSESRMQAAAMGIYDEGVMDPVCGMYIDEKKARAANRTVKFGGETYHFCSPECQHDFEKSPRKFLGQRTASPSAEQHREAQHKNEHQHQREGQAMDVQMMDDKQRQGQYQDYQSFDGPNQDDKKREDQNKDDQNKDDQNKDDQNIDDQGQDDQQTDKQLMEEMQMEQQRWEEQKKVEKNKELSATYSTPPGARHD